MKKLPFIYVALFLYFIVLQNVFALPLATLTVARNFPSQVQIGKSFVAEYQISNNVSGTLPITITYPAGLTEDENDCGSSLAQGASCTVKLKYYMH